MNVLASLLAVAALWSSTLCEAQVMRYWQRTYDEMEVANGIGSVVVQEDTSYVVSSLTFFTQPGRLRWTTVSKDGDTLTTRLIQDSAAGFQGGGARSIEQHPDGQVWFAGSTVPFAGDEPDGRLICFDNEGDTCWSKRYGTPAFETLNGLCLTPDGGGVSAGVRQTSQSDVYVVRVDSSGDTLWTRTYGGAATTENAITVRPSFDGGFIIGGFKVLPGNNYDLYALKLDANGDLEWQRNYGSPWIDNTAFIEALPDGRYVMAGGERVSATSEKQPALYLLDEDGFEEWSVIYTEDTMLRVFFTVPVLMGEGGYAIAGTADAENNIVGFLMRTDSLGQTLWRRTYQTNTNFDHYIYDLRRTLDGGFIMAGTAWDSLLVSQDAWLVKTDSFGCLLPGCQVFDGLEEQITDLGEALYVFPNPASEGVAVEITLPSNYTTRGSLRLALVSADGKLVHDEAVPQGWDPCRLTLTGLSPGMYFLHLLDGHRWLAGSKLVVR